MSKPSRTHLFVSAYILFTIVLLVFCGCLIPPSDGAPASPGAPTLAAGDSQLAVSWTAVSSATAYEVWYHTADTPAAAGKFGNDVTILNITITSLTNNTPYYVWLRAKNGHGMSGWSPSAAATPRPVSPSAPAAPVVAPGNGQLSVSWSPVLGAQAYEVWYSQTNNSGTAAKFGSDVIGTSTDITGLTNTVTYYIWLKAKNTGGTSGFSPVGSGTPQPNIPNPPGAPTVTPGDGELAVSWSAVSGSTAYEVWYGQTNDTLTASQYGGDVTGTSTTMTGLTNNVTYYVWVKAKNTGGTSGFSIGVNGTPFGPPNIIIKKIGIDVPSGSQGNDFGSLYETQESSEVVFTISNTGTGPLTISGISMGGGDADQFILNLTGTASVLPVDGNTIFKIRFHPTSPGSMVATVTILNNDPDEATYVFTVVGNGLTAPGKDWTERVFPDTLGMGGNAWAGLTASSDRTKMAAIASPGYIYTTYSSGDFWAEQRNAGRRNWRGIASSSNGSNLAAAAFDGYIYTSTDSGVTWVERTNAGSRQWFRISSSSDGTMLAAGVDNGYIYTSTDGGANWTERVNAGSRRWRSICSSDDGTKLAAGVEGGYIYTSVDGGITWTERTGAGSRSWYSIASSADGTRLAAAGYSQYIYTSADGGATWTERDPGAMSGTLWSTIASSADGMTLAAGFYNTSDNYVYTSNDAGASWTLQTHSGSHSWVFLVSSADGTKLAGLAGWGYFYRSNDGGVWWTERRGAGTRDWNSIGSSADGNVLAAVAYYGNAYISTDQGITWVEREVAPGRPWRSIAVSSNGQSMALCGSVTNIYTTTDGGANWTERTGAGFFRSWRAITLSADGSKLAAAEASGYIYTSTDGGATWAERTACGSRYWWTMASSADGSKLAAGVNGGYIYTSHDSGATWVEQTSAGHDAWNSIASSADGMKLVAVSTFIYTSIDGGNTWTKRASAGNRFWNSAAISTDGMLIVAAEGTDQYTGNIYTSLDGGATWTMRAAAGTRNWTAVTSSADGTILAGVANSDAHVFTSP